MTPRSAFSPMFCSMRGKACVVRQRHRHKEESGLEVEILSQKPAQHFAGRKFLYPPVYLDVHPITTTHQHIGLVYFAKAASDQVTLAADEHEAIRWFSEAELHDPAFGIQPDVRFYACEVLRRAAEAPT